MIRNADKNFEKHIAKISLNIFKAKIKIKKVKKLVTKNKGMKGTLKNNTVK